VAGNYSRGIDNGEILVVEETFGHLKKFKASLQNKEAPLGPCV